MSEGNQVKWKVEGRMEGGRKETKKGDEGERDANTRSWESSVHLLEAEEFAIYDALAARGGRKTEGEVKQRRKCCTSL